MMIVRVNELKKVIKENELLIVIIISMLLWGGTWTSAKIVSDNTTKEVIVFWRFFVTFISFLPIVLYKRESLKLNKFSFILVILGTASLVCYNLLFFGGLRVGLPGAGGVIVTTISPIITFLISAILFKQKIKKKEIVGLIIGLSGGMIILEIWKIIAGSKFQGGDLYFIFAAIFWALLTLTSQKSKKNLSPITFSFYTYGLSALIDFIIAIPNGLFTTSYFTLEFTLNILYLSLGATTFATTAYFIATTKLGANKSSSYTFLVPTSAIFFSWIILNEVPKINSIIGGIFALIAVYIINYKTIIKVNKIKQVEIVA
ncbi:MAG: drug/metabolite transporter [Haloplasmataceae bacterium]|jgi:drug/metabolite transporter (DMT)-like permease|nr:drug/metabolite transporter [Haloplasmataceae bacterium]